ncbi:helix-turn-helix domain-containing protein [Agrobacterium vitis]|uniref:Helix-turn-helix domain-containing protein n=2 Tax=Agrobacterium vitis TaxID=373 RepID=A0AAE5AW34_AGRVI|nr:helix-turn-helix domain-containing protein [Allorhizobium sp. Av2]MCM2439411.1 helix-turn-helix domain-containing protein [Agrobacterium vitis]MUZ57685.1 helix-turn-helix domain-containing protein [Agrobacterium vitis]
MAGDTPTLLFEVNTRKMSLQSALEFWQESAGSMYDVKIFQPDAFHTAHSTVRFGGLLLTHCASVAQKLSRSSYRIGTDGYDHFTVQFFLAGQWSRQDGRREEKAGPGDLIIHDTAQTHAGAASDFVNVTLFVPRSLLAPLLNSPDEQNMRVLAADDPMVGLLRNHVSNLWRALPLLSERQAAALAMPTTQLVAAVLNGGSREDTIQGVATAQLAEIRHYIQAHIWDKDLSAGRIAMAFGISPRKLAYLFSGWGGVMSYVQRQRLELARRALRDPAQVHKSIADVGLEHGFIYAHNFTRAFQRVYGLTPREVRSMAQKSWIVGISGSHSWFDRAARWGR